MEKKTKKMAAALAVVAVVLMVAAGLLIYQGRSPWPDADKETCRFFVNGQWLEQGERPDRLENSATDYKCVVDMEQGVTLYNYPAGYRVWLPEGLEWDFTHSNRVAKADGADFSVTISGEWSPYEDVDGYLQFYQNRFYESEYFRESNGLTLLQDETVETAGMETRLLTLSFGEDSALPYRVYTFAYQKQGRNYMRYLFRGESFDEAYEQGWSRGCPPRTRRPQKCPSRACPARDSSATAPPSARPSWGPALALALSSFLPRRRRESSQRS